MSERTYLSMHAKLYLYIISLFLETMRTKFFERKINWNNRKEGKKKPVRKEMTNPMSGVRVSMGKGDVARGEGGDHRRREGSGPRSADWNTVASGGSWPWSVTGES